MRPTPSLTLGQGMATGVLPITSTSGDKSCGRGQRPGSHGGSCRERHPCCGRNGTVTDLASRGLDYAIAINDVGAVLAGASGRTPWCYQSVPVPSARSVAFDGGSTVDINDAGAVVGRVNLVAVIVTREQWRHSRTARLPAHRASGPSTLRGRWRDGRSKWVR